ncbi:MAG: hypothetical protein GSR85_02120 [Desulfurococcales archaeon]|nr:hypothetical protein [Desulfurococcales archaeon]
MSKPLTLTSRLFIVVGVALILSGVLADVVGAKEEAVKKAVIEVGDRPGVAITVFAISSSGRASITLEGADRIYYMTLRGDPMLALRQLSTINITLENQAIKHDFRVGIAYGHAVLNTNPLLLTTLPLLANIIPVNMSGAPGGKETIEARIKGGEGLLVIATPSDTRITYTIEYKVEGYKRIGLTTTIMIGTALIVLGSLQAVRREALTR